MGNSNSNNNDKWISIGLITFIVLLFIVIIIAIYKCCERYNYMNHESLNKLRLTFMNFFECGKNSTKFTGELEILNGEKNEMKEWICKILKYNLFRGEKSYTINKARVFICIKDTNTGKIYDIHLLTYVLAHELAHVICDEIGHTEKFHRIFDDMLALMEKEGLYDSTIVIDPSYCQDGDYSFDTPDVEADTAHYSPDNPHDHLI